ncbi:MAG: glycerate kinase [Gemmatimonadota bacterium]
MILSCPTAFKGTIDARPAAHAMATGARRAFPGREVVELPLSDGGNGLIDALHAARGGVVESVSVTGPLGASVRARVLRLADAAVVETADANGLHLVPPELRDPMVTTTYGVGELLLAAADAPRLIAGLGGSATVDGGIGMAQALGWRLLDVAGLPVGRGGTGLERLARIRPPDRMPALPPITVLYDVRNPLLGEQGAAPVFGPQKGASPGDVRRLAAGLAGLAECLSRDVGRDVRGLSGGGAAGGLGAALAGFLGAELVPGGDWVLEAVGFDAALARADIVVTGEGAFDVQSGMGKVVGEVIRRARARRVPVLLVAGAVDGALPDGVHAVTGRDREGSPRERPAGALAAPVGGRVLDPADLMALVARELPGVLGG